MPEAGFAGEIWQRFEIRRIEDLRNAVLGAELEAIQMAGPSVCGSLAFAATDGLVCSSGRIDGNVALRGVLSADAVTFAVLLKAGPGSRLHLSAVADGMVSICLPGDEMDVYCTVGTLYLAVSLTPGHLARQVAPPRLTGARTAPMAARTLETLVGRVVALHRTGSGDERIGRDALRVILNHYAAQPLQDAPELAGDARVVRLAEDYIRHNLASPISTSELVAAAGTSPRSLYRAFGAVLGDTPQGHVRRLRLHCVRRRLLATDQPTCTVVDAARRLGLARDMGRLSLHYRELFGEPPSATLARRRAYVEGARLL